MNQFSAPASTTRPSIIAAKEDAFERLTFLGWRTGLTAIVETVATSVARGTWRRLKICAAADCRWVFYDDSRNGAGRWCSMAACGNRVKTRTYRQRQRAT